MQKILTAFIICLMIVTSLVGTVDAGLQVGGYYKNFSTVFNSPLPDASMMGVVVNRLRLNLSYVATDSLSFDFAYDFTPRVQDPLLFSQSPIAVGIASSRYRVADLDSPIYPRQMNPSAVSASTITSIVLPFSSAQISRISPSVETQSRGAVHGS